MEPDQSSVLDRSKLPEAICDGRAVLVVGPGCHRVGYDDERNPPWAEIRHRVRILHEQLADRAGPDTGAGAQLFLKRFWMQRLSEETWSEFRETLANGGLPRMQSIDADEREIREPTTLDALRTKLLVPLINALRNCTMHIGSAIATGEQPVVRWQRLSGPISTNDESLPPGAGHVGASAVDVDDDTLEEINEQSLDRAERSVDKARKIARAILNWSNLDPLTLQDKAALSDLSTLVYPGSTPTPEQANALRAIRIGRVAELLDVLYSRYLRLQPERAVTVATVEWLADLIWLVLVADSGLVLSESEMATYLNLAVGSTEPAAFTRAQPGDLRTSGRADPRDATDVIAEVAERSMMPLDNNNQTFWNTPRVSLACTIAATLFAQWRTANTSRSDPDFTRLPLTLVSDYDLMLETALMAAADKDQTFHVIIPVNAGLASRKGKEWVIGDFTRRGRYPDRESIDTTTWRWLKSVGSAPQAWQDWSIKGPVIIKTHGSPLHRARRSHDDQESERFKQVDTGWIAGADEKETGDRGIDHQVAYSEREVLEAIQSLIKLRDGEEAGFLSNELKWSGRSWLFLGQRFPDYLPRLRLYMTAAEAGATQQKTSSSKRTFNGPAQRRLTEIHVAVDRQFSWPESAFLESLEVGRVVARLQDIDRYWRRNWTTSQEFDDFTELADRYYRRAANEGPFIDWHSREGGRR